MKTDTTEIPVYRLSLPILVSRAKATLRRLLRRRTIRKIVAEHTATLRREHPDTFRVLPWGWTVTFRGQA
jgi:hypothetical protein